MVKNIIIAFLAVCTIALTAKYLSIRFRKIETGAPWWVYNYDEKTFKNKVLVAAPNEKGYMLLTASSHNDTTGQCIIMDMSGKVIFNKKTKGGPFDFRQWHIGNKVYYTTGVHDTGGYRDPILDQHIPAGYILVMDSAMNEIKTLRALSYGDVKIDKNQGMDIHDLMMIDENHYFTLVSYEKEVNNIPAELNAPPHKKVFACLIQEIVNDKVVWQWDASRFPEFYSNYVANQSFTDSLPIDYCHVNTLTLDSKDSNLILSFRDQNQIIKINRKSGEIMWRLGGKNSDFALTEEQIFRGQHAVKFAEDNETLRFLDNGHPEIRPYTRIVEIKLDKKNKKVSSFVHYTLPNAFIPQRGNVQKVNGKYLVCGGYSKYIAMIDPKTDNYIFYSKGNHLHYRVYWTDNIYGLESKK